MMFPIMIWLAVSIVTGLLFGAVARAGSGA